MYIPNAFRETDIPKLHKFMGQYGFAMLITNGPQGMMASHLPILVDVSQGPLGTLTGHFARANEQSAELGQEALIIFSGPHTYVSPTWYEAPNTVPTWNYVAVHAYGVLEPVTDRDELGRILCDLTRKYEEPRQTPWAFDASTEFHQKLMDGIVGFKVQITRLEGKWKLSQNHLPERRQKVIQALRTMGGEDRLAIADLMQATLPEAQGS